MRFPGIFGSKKSPEQLWAENKAKEIHGQLQKAGNKNFTVTVEVPQKSAAQEARERQSQPQKQSFIERFRSERSTQIEARQQQRQQQNQTHKHTQK
ncbi:MAG: hypothetical protein ABSC76_18225 [Terracidiphilus sp.]|jgi:hypothetical protein